MTTKVLGFLPILHTLRGISDRSRLSLLCDLEWTLPSLGFGEFSCELIIHG